MGSQTAQDAKDYFTTAYEYTIRFYPRYLTWIQQTLSKPNVLGGPASMGPDDKMVVAMNDDTLYAQVFLDLSSGPIVLTIPAYAYSYSVLQLDMFGTVLNINSLLTSALLTTNGGSDTSYTLCTADQKNQASPDTTAIVMPYKVTILIIRVDKYFNKDGTYQDVRLEASEFRAKLQLDSNPTPDKRALILPLVPFYTPSPKMMADEAARFLPGSFIATLQEALANTEEAMLDANGGDIISTFNNNYQEATAAAYTTPIFLAEIFRGVQAAHTALVNHWHMSRGTSNWIHFDNIGTWGTGGSYTYQDYLDRAALNEYIQYGNNSTACYYAHIFVDQNGIQLNGDSSYTITFSNSGDTNTAPQPEYDRFWSITAYTAEAIELVDNPMNKYVVASYTPGLVDNGSTITIYVQNQFPTAENTANWLPVPKGPFNLMLRVYGPQGDAATSPATYVPPPVVRTT